MPPLVVAAAAWVAETAAVAALTVGASVAVAGIVAVAAYGVTTLAIYYGISRVMTALAPKPNMGSVRSSGTQIMVSGTSESHRILYGQPQVSGVFYPLGVTGTSNEYLHFILIYAAHKCAEFSTLNVAGEEVTVDGSGNVTSGKYAGLLTVKSHLGAWNQTVDTNLQTAFGTTFWPSTARLQGRAYDYFRLKYDQNVSAGGVPAITRLIKGREVYDWRDGAQDPADPDTWVWSADAALCNADWLMGVPYRNGAGNVVRNFGFRAAAAEVASADVIEAANICDEAISLSGGGTEARYESHGLIQTSATRGDVQDALRSSMVGDICFVGGKWLVRAGAYRTPNATTLTLDDFRAPISNLQVKPSRRDLANGVKGSFVSPTNNWQASDFPAFVKLIPAANLVAGDHVQIAELGTTDFTLIGAAANTVGTIFTASGAGTGTGKAESYIVEDGGDRLWLDIELPFTISPTAAQRIAKIQLERLRQGITYVGHYKLTALQHQVTDVVAQDFSRYGWSGKTFRVENQQTVIENAPNGTPMIGCDLLLHETAAGVYTWDPAEERAADVAPNTTLPNPFSVANLSGLTLLADNGTGFTQTDGTWAPRLLVSWTAPSDIYVISGGKVEIEYKKHADSDWIAWSAVPGALTSDYLTDVHTEVAYDVRARFTNQTGANGAYTTVSNYTVPKRTLGAADPTAFAGHAPSSSYPCPQKFYSGVRMLMCSLTWTRSTDTTAKRYEFFLSTSNSIAPSPVSPKCAEATEEVTYFDQVLVVSHLYVWARTIDLSDVASSLFYTGVDLQGLFSYPAAGMSEQEPSAVAVTGIETGSGSSVQQVLCRYPGTSSGTLTGGANYEKVNVSLTNRGFSTKPDVGSVTFDGGYGIDAYYDKGDAASTSTNAVIFIYRPDGTNLAAGAYTLNFILEEFN